MKRYSRKHKNQNPKPRRQDRIQREGIRTGLADVIRFFLCTPVVATHKK